MYQFALRLARDTPGLKGVQGQAKCLLAAMNALRLGDPKFAWVMRPASSVDDENDEEDDDVMLDECASPPKRPCGLAVTESVSCCACPWNEVFVSGLAKVGFLGYSVLGFFCKNLKSESPKFRFYAKVSF